VKEGPVDRFFTGIPLGVQRAALAQKGTLSDPQRPGGQARTC
jgi:hypothetical protein